MRSNMTNAQPFEVSLHDGQLPRADAVAHAGGGCRGSHNASTGTAHRNANGPGRRAFHSSARDSVALGSRKIGFQDTISDLPRLTALSGVEL